MLYCLINVYQINCNNHSVTSEDQNSSLSMSRNIRLKKIAAPDCLKWLEWYFVDRLHASINNIKIFSYSFQQTVINYNYELIMSLKPMENTYVNSTRM